MRRQDSSGIFLATVLLFVAGVIAGPPGAPRSGAHRPAPAHPRAPIVTAVAAANPAPAHLGAVARQ